MTKDFVTDYVDVATRIGLFREKHPDGSLQPFDPADPVKVITIADKTFLQYVAAAYRSPDDLRPGIGTAWEPFPGRTPYTKDSEAMNVESSAWGRAIVAALAADTRKGVASADEVRSRQDQEPPSPSPLVIPSLPKGIARLAQVNSLEALANFRKMALDYQDQGLWSADMLVEFERAAESARIRLAPHA